MKHHYLAIITARSGSKRLPGKNVRELCGQPLFVWSVFAAIATPHIARTIVCTDSSDYQRIAKEAGAECPWLRDPALATDGASSADVVAALLERLADSLSQYHGIVLLQPTSPLRTANDIIGALELFESRSSPAVVSISRTECSPTWMGQLPSSLVMDDFTPPQFQNLNQNLSSDWYRLNGAIYVISIEVFLREHRFMPAGSLGYIMPRERSIDIDTEFDFKIASLLMAQAQLCGQP
ncbi:acylneuraminate cytidylyltransferase family protein [Microcystis elabens FACHB-917]|nr:acylneuraminate cytidylyltransferase family protein [Microcystis elabens FACHB-917]